MTDINQQYEYRGACVNGFLMALFTFILMPVLVFYTIYFLHDNDLQMAILLVAELIVIAILACGFVIQQPNEARVLIFFGKYVGTCNRQGFFWLNPFITRKKLSLRIRNMDIEPIKVNDKIGNPVMIGMVLVWRIKDTYKVMFDLDSTSATGGISNSSLVNFVGIQSDAALREVTGRFAYDSAEDHPGGITLRDGGEEINKLLEDEINDRLAMAGIEVVEARLNYLAYAPEIAAVMLRRQQAAAIITAREKIVEGAVSMVESALRKIDEKGFVEFTPEKKADMVSNLLVVLCGDEPAQPVINT